jgi:hypothetical protein
MSKPPELTAYLRRNGAAGTLGGHMRDMLDTGEANLME